MVSKLRAQRIAERIREELSDMIIHSVADPRVRGISITDVTVDRELAFANIFVSSVAGPDDKDDILAGLRHAQGYLRSELARRINLRAFPRLRFHWDPTPERAARIDQLLDSLGDSGQSEGEGETDD